MASLDIKGARIATLAEGVRSGKLKARELTEAYLDRVKAVDPQLNSYLLIDGAGARLQADAIDKAVAGGEAVGPLAGVPIALKDIFVT